MIFNQTNKNAGDVNNIGVSDGKAIMLWHFEDAPKELQLPYNGGDEDFCILIPRLLDNCYALGVLENIGNSNDIYRVNNDGTVDKREGNREWDDRIGDEVTGWVLTGWFCPNYPGCTIIIASHA